MTDSAGVFEGAKFDTTFSHLHVYQERETPGGKTFYKLTHSIPYNTLITQVYQGYDIHPEIEKYEELFEERPNLKLHAARYYYITKNREPSTKEIYELFNVVVPVRMKEEWDDC